MLDSMMNSSIVWAITAVLGVFGTIYGVVSNIKNKRHKRFSYIIDSNRVISNSKTSYEKLSITYDGQKISSFCVSRITVWNSGNVIINSADMVSGRELTISVPDDVNILDASIILENDETNKFSLHIVDSHTVKIFFDYVGLKDGFVVELLHNGRGSKLEISYVIKDGESPKGLNDKETAFSKALKRAMSRFFFDRKWTSLYLAISTGVVFLSFLCLTTLAILINKGIIVDKRIIEFVIGAPTSGMIPIPLAITMLLGTSILFFVSLRIALKEFKISVPASLRH